MEKITFDSGIREFEINGRGVLRFNPSDPNVYDRLFHSIDEINAVESELVEEAKKINSDDGSAVLRLMAQADKQVKNILNDIFGHDNDFDDILGGVNVMAVCGNGERAITNLLNALIPIIQEGAEQCARQQADKAVEEARAARTLRLK